MEHLLESLKVVPLAFAALFPVVNPLGTSLILLGMTDGLDHSTRRVAAAKIALNTFFLLTAVLLTGAYVLSFFGLTIPVVQVAGGFVVAAMGWDLLRQEERPGDHVADDGSLADRLKENLFYPYTFPITVGPGCIAVTLTLSAHAQHGGVIAAICNEAAIVVAILAVSAVMYVSFTYSDVLARRLGANGTKVLLRIMAFILVCLGGQISWTGIADLAKQVLKP